MGFTKQLKTGGHPVTGELDIMGLLTSHRNATEWRRGVSRPSRWFVAEPFSLCVGGLDGWLEHTQDQLCKWSSQPF